MKQKIAQGTRLCFIPAQKGPRAKKSGAAAAFDALTINQIFTVRRDDRIMSGLAHALVADAQHRIKNIGGDRAISGFDLGAGDKSGPQVNPPGRQGADGFRQPDAGVIDHPGIHGFGGIAVVGLQRR